MFDLFVVTAPGLEALAEREVLGLGLTGKAVPGGVELRGSLLDVQRLNLWLRSATRVLVRLGTVKATAFPELVRKASELPWAVFVKSGARVQVRATCRKSRLYHSGGVAERLLLSLQSKVKNASAVEDAGSGSEESVAGQLILARFDHDVCTISIDSSGALLHMRGWRGPQAKAPLRETLAAALLLLAGYTGDEPLADPLCGSGTIAIEGALMAMRRAPGLSRRFAFEEWPQFVRRGWDEQLAQARSQERPMPAAVEASDQDAGAVAATNENALKAGVAVRISQRRLLDLPAGPGLIACNPPYGVRIAAGSVWRDLGEAVRRRASWRVAAVIADEKAAFEARLRFTQMAKTETGGLRIALSLAQS